jgi:DNA-binding protein YbaB
MSDDRRDAVARLTDETASFARRAQAAAGAAADARGEDSTGTVSVRLDEAGRVAAVQVTALWRERVGADALGDAVREAVQAAGVARLSAWGERFAGDTAEDVPEPAPLDRDNLAERLHQLTSPGRMTTEDTRAALLELLALVEDMERGIDEVTERLPAVESAVHLGRSADRHVTVSLTGGGEVREIRYDRGWLAAAHEINIGRQTGSAFAAAYEAAGRESVDQVIARSRLGEVQRATQDPLGLARRLRLTD